MLTGLRRNLSLVGPLLGPRKLRLLCCALYRHACGDVGSFAAVLDLAERFADGRADAYELATARYGRRNVGFPPAWTVCWPPDRDALQMTTRALSILESVRDDVREEQARIDLFDDVSGHLLRPRLKLDPAWLAWQDCTVPRVARALYDERRFDQLPILADALMDAGCTEQSIMDHLVSSGSHVRGCWAMDLILGQE